jgi:large subunit ribosomal protein L18
MDKYERRTRRKKGIRKNIHGTKVKPRVSVYRSNRHIFVQAIDDETGVTLCSVSDVEAGVKRNTEGALNVGEKLAEKLKKGKVQEAVFDRNGFLYHGIVKSVADGVRKGGIRV